jgi:hypothetical protein
MVTLVKLLQLRNARTPIVVTEDGMVTLVKLPHKANAYSPIVVTEDGMVTLVRLLHPSNARSPMVVTGKPINSFGITRANAEPLYLSITTPRESIVYSKSPSECLESPLEPSLEADPKAVNANPNISVKTPIPFNTALFFIKTP